MSCSQTCSVSTQDHKRVLITGTTYTRDIMQCLYLFKVVSVSNFGLMWIWSKLEGIYFYNQDFVTTIETLEKEKEKKQRHNGSTD